MSSPVHGSSSSIRCSAARSRSLKEEQLTNRIRRPQRPSGETDTALDPRQPSAGEGSDPDGYLAIGLMIGILVILALLTLAMVISIQ